MSVEAMKVNELLEKAADFCRQKADEIHAFVNDDIRNSNFELSAGDVADDLKKIADKICDLTLDEEEA